MEKQNLKWYSCIKCLGIYQADGKYIQDTLPVIFNGVDAEILPKCNCKRDKITKRLINKYEKDD